MAINFNPVGAVRFLPAFLRRHKLVRLLIRLFPSLAIQLVRFNRGAKVYADLSDAFPRDYFLTKSYDPEFFRIALPFMRGGKVFFDVGANYGFCSFGLMAELDPQKTEYHLFEANEEIMPSLERSSSAHRENKIKISRACVTDKPGVSRILTKKGSLELSYVDEKGTQQAGNLILDDYIRENKISRVDFMKIDVEGHELHVLNGARRSLESGVIGAIYMEASWVNWKRNDRPLTDCFKLLEECGFSLFYAKEVDFQNSPAVEEVHAGAAGEKIKVRPLTEFPEGHQTDILAIHKKFLILEKTGRAA